LFSALYVYTSHLFSLFINNPNHRKTSFARGTDGVLVVIKEQSNHRIMKISTLVVVLVVAVSIVPILFVSMVLQSEDNATEGGYLRDTLTSSRSALTPAVQSIASLPNPSGVCPENRKLDWDSLERRERFPSVDERVCLYMTRWFDPHYQTANQWKPMLSASRLDELTIDILWNGMYLYTMQMQEDLLLNDVPFFMYRDNMTLMQDWKHQKHWIMFVFYAGETIKFWNFFSNSSEAPAEHPILFDWGDQEMKIDVQLPIAAKWRFNDILQHTRPVPIVVPMEGAKHYGPLKQVKENDIAWAEKKNEAVWRGVVSGIIDGKFYYDYDFQNATHATCMKFPRCRMVYQNQDTPMANIGFASCHEKALQVINGIDMVRSKMPMKEQLQYKMLISVEGNDVATGLKWNLLSNSVVLMPPPQKSIFSMEFLLEPYVHYVPLDVDHVETAIQWVLEHDEEAQRIAQRASNFIRDLFFHFDAEKDNDVILQQMANRVSALWS
jgi:hypothetical protein